MTLIIMIFIGVNARYSIEFVESVLLRESEKKFWFFFSWKGSFDWMTSASSFITHILLR